MNSREKPGNSDSRATEPTIGFSVAITVCKREYLLPYALQSVLRQAQACGEIIVLSDGCSRTKVIPQNSV